MLTAIKFPAVTSNEISSLTRSAPGAIVKAGLPSKVIGFELASSIWFPDLRLATKAWIVTGSVPVKFEK